MAHLTDGTMRQRLLKMTVIFLAAEVFICCVGRNSSHKNTTDGETAVTIEEPTIVKDSIDILIDQRAEQEFNSTIFSGLHFGSNRKSVERVLRNKGTYSTEIPIQVPNGDKVEEVIVRDYDAVYDGEKLVSLVLYANEARLLEALDVLYSTKYGKTKNHTWSFANCEISIETRSRVLYNTHKSNINNPDLFYNSYHGKNTESITKERDFLVITYLSKTLQREMERKIFVRDSIERKRLEKEAELKTEQEKELAKKLSTEVATGI